MKLNYLYSMGEGRILLFIFSFITLIYKSLSFEVIEISNDIYDIKTNEHVVLYFHAPWSSNSKQNLNEFKKFAMELNENESLKGLNITFGFVSSKNYFIIEEFDIKHYPSIFYMKNGIKFEYSGSINSDYLADWLER